MKNTPVFCAALMALTSLAQAGGSYAPASGPAVNPVMTKVSEPISERFYIDLKGGALFVDDIGDFSFDTGWGITGAFGVNLGHGLSVEVESGYLTADVEGFDGETEFDAGSLVGDVTLVPVLANVKYAFPITRYFNGYIGAGIGALYSDTDVSIGSYTAGGDDWEFAFQGIAGISIPMSEVLSFDIGYRFLATDVSSDDLRTHSVQAGINFKF